MATGLGWRGPRPRVERGPAEATWRAANGVGVFAGGDPSPRTPAPGSGHSDVPCPHPCDLGRPGPLRSLGLVTGCGPQCRARPPGSGVGPRWAVGAGWGGTPHCLQLWSAAMGPHKLRPGPRPLLPG